MKKKYSMPKPSPTSTFDCILTVQCLICGKLKQGIKYIAKTKITYTRDWFSLKLFKALNISTTTRTVIDTVDGWRSSNMLQGYAVCLVEQVSKLT